MAFFFGNSVKEDSDNQESTIYVFYWVYNSVSFPDFTIFCNYNLRMYLYFKNKDFNLKELNV